MRVRFMLIETITFHFDDEFEVVLSVWFASTARRCGIKVLLAVIRQSRFVTLHSINIIIIIIMIIIAAFYSIITVTNFISSFGTPILCLTEFSIHLS